MGKKKRPEWWCEAWFLDKFEEVGKVNDVCIQAEEKCGRELSASTFYGDVLQWRRSPIFMERYDKVMAENFRSNATRFAERVAKKNSVLSTMEQYEAFIEIWIRNGCIMTKACEEFGVHPGYVYLKLNENSKDFDEQFKRLFELAEGQVVASVYDRTFENATRGGPVGLGDTGAQRLILTNRAPYLFPEKKRVDVTQTSEVKVEIGPRLLAAVRDKQRALNGHVEGIDVPMAEIGVVQGEIISESRQIEGRTDTSDE